MRAYCYNRNISDVISDGKTPYELRFGQPFHGVLLPFGCRVEYKPESDRETKKLQKFGSKLRPGIFMGHHSHNGGAWSGDYYVVGAEAFTTSTDTQRAYVHRVQEIMHDGELVFPSRTAFSYQPTPSSVNALGLKGTRSCSQSRARWTRSQRT